MQTASTLTPAALAAHNTQVADIPTAKAFYVGLHRGHFQSGTPAEILGVVIVPQPGGEQRPCFHLRHADGREDYAPMADRDHVGPAGLGTLYQIISEEQVEAGDIPPVVN